MAECGRTRGPGTGERGSAVVTGRRKGAVREGSSPTQQGNGRRGSEKQCEEGTRMTQSGGEAARARSRTTRRMTARAIRGEDDGDDVRRSRRRSSSRRRCLVTTGDGVRPATIRGRGFRQVQREGEEGTEESERGGTGDSERRRARSPRSRSWEGVGTGGVGDRVSS